MTSIPRRYLFPGPTSKGFRALGLEFLKRAGELLETPCLQMAFDLLRAARRLQEKAPRRLADGMRALAFAAEEIANEAMHGRPVDLVRVAILKGCVEEDLGRGEFTTAARRAAARQVVAAKLRAFVDTFGTRYGVKGAQALGALFGDQAQGQDAWGAAPDGAEGRYVRPGGAPLERDLASVDLLYAAAAYCDVAGADGGRLQPFLSFVLDDGAQAARLVGVVMTLRAPANQRSAAQLLLGAPPVPPPCGWPDPCS